MTRKPLRIGIGGPVGSGKTALVDSLCKLMRERYRLGVVTNDIFTREDMEFLVRSEALPADRIIGVQTGGCPHTAIREDASMNFEAIEEMALRHPDLDVVFLESGGDNLAASFSPELVDASTLKREVVEGLDLIILRELSSDLYYGEPRGFGLDVERRCRRVRRQSEVEVLGDLPGLLGRCHRRE